VSVARPAGAIVATTGGFSAPADSAGFQGAPSGAAVYGGRLAAVLPRAEASVVVLGRHMTGPAVEGAHAA